MSDCRLRRVVLETSLKPFLDLSASGIRRTCGTILEQWAPLFEDAEAAAILFWTGDGDELLRWNNDLSAALDWGRYIGHCGLHYEVYPGVAAHYQQPVPYVVDPLVITYADLRDIVATFKHLGRSQHGKLVQCGTTVDPGPEFIHSAWKFEEHPEVMRGGRDSPRGATFPFSCCYTELQEDHARYAGFRHGIPDETTFGRFLGTQAKLFCEAMGFDYLWLSNGLGYSHYPWSAVGENFDGEQFGLVDFNLESNRIVSFYQEFRDVCPSLRLETRGTNFSIGLDLATDCIPHRDIYATAKLPVPPVNPPWGSRDLGMEMTAQLSRIAVLPKNSFDARLYVNDPWFHANPWWDYYHQEPYDYYLPLTAARVNGMGQTQTADSLALLTIDTELGELNPETAREVIPHLRRALQHRPDEPGPLTWLYPYDELRRMAMEDAEGQALCYFTDSFIRCAINRGLPLNTVLSTIDFVACPLESLGETVLVTPLPRYVDGYVHKLLDWIDAGGKVLFYGPAFGAATDLRDRLNLTDAEPLEGQLEFRRTPEAAAVPLRHNSTLSGGPIREKLLLDDTQSFGTVLRGVVEQAGEQRVYALARGNLAWVRGSAPFSLAKGQTKWQPLSPEESLDTSAWLVHLLSDLGLTLAQEVPSPHGRHAALFLSRCDNALWVTGHKPDATVSLRLGLPEGVPILTERETGIVAGTGLYYLDRTFHHECRVWVRQNEGWVQCKEQQHPTGTSRRLTISGLESARVTIRPPRSRLAETVVSGAEATEIDAVRGVVIVPQASGSLTVTW